MNTTPASLLQRLRDEDATDAWHRFVDLYTPLLAHWARRLGLSKTDGDDLVQEVFLILVRELPRFVYQPGRRFRGWLWTVLRNKYHEKHRRAAEPVAGEMALAALSVPDDLEAVWEREYQQYVVGRAAAFIEAEFQPATWKAFWESVVHDRPAADVARDLGVSENAVYLAKGRVLRRLRQELDGLLE